ncbi:hypothetical protein M9Y10_035765 [Tritrichomonas musculus]|uniref:Chorein N-terminal domain-containing protein n=1 Tax=Tritrichomonas musculus TaxID=1915356 RepID=A0ABR2GWP0_9EUKA
MTEVKKRNISGSLTRKNLEISQLEIFPDALLQHNVPLLVKKGTIKNINIQIPTKFKTDPITLTIDSVTILCSICTHDPVPDEIINMKFHMLKAHQYFRKCYKMILGYLHKESFFSFVRLIMSNLIMEVNHIHIQIEYSSRSHFDLTIPNIVNSKTFKSDFNQEKNDKHDKKKFDVCKNLSEDSSLDNFYEESIDETIESFEEINLQRLSSYSTFQSKSELNNNDTNTEQEPEKVTSIGITINKLVLRNDEKNKESSNIKITKEAIFNDFGIYMDVGEHPIDPSTDDKFETELNNIYVSKKHNWILQPFTFSGFLNFNHGDPQLFFDPIIKKVLVNVKEEYIPVILDILNVIDTFQKKFSVANIPKPQPDDPVACWQYVHKCAVSKISNATHDFTKSLSLLLKRHAYLKNYKRKNEKSREIIKQMEETLDYENIVAFRSAYRLTHHKKRKAKGKSKITAKTTRKITKDIRIDPIHIVTKLIGMMSLNFQGELVKIALKKKNGQKHVVVNIKNPNFIIEKKLNSIHLQASASYICAKYVRDKEIIVFKSFDNDDLEMKADIRIPFHSYSNWIVSLEMSNNNYIINLKGLFQLVTDIGLIQLFTSKIRNSKVFSQIKKKNLDMNVYIFDSVVKIVGSKCNRAFQITFEKLQFFTDPKTKEKKINLNKSLISLITDNEAKISSDFSLSGTFNGNKISLSVPFFTCNVPFNYFVVNEDFLTLFLQYQSYFRDSSFPKINIDFALKLSGMDIDVKISDLIKIQKVQIRDIIFTFKDSIFNFMLSSLTIPSLFSLNNMSAYYNEKILNLKISHIWVKLVELIQMIPKDAYQMFIDMNASSRSSVTNDNEMISASDDEEQPNNINIISNFESTIKEKEPVLPKIKFGFDIDNCDVFLSINKTEQIKMNILNIKASHDNNIINASAFLNHVIFDEQIISQQISFQSEIIINKITEVTMNIDSFDLIFNQVLVNYILNLKLPLNNIVLPNDFELKLSLKLNEMSLSDDFKINDLIVDAILNNTKIFASIKMDSISSSLINLKSKDVIQMNANLKQKEIDLTVNLQEITVYIVPLIDFITNFPKLYISKPQIKLNIRLLPFRCNFDLAEDDLNVIFNSPIKVKLDTISTSFSLKISNFVINLNNNEIMKMDSLLFTIDKSVIINLPSIIVNVSMVEIYKIIKITSDIIETSITNIYKPLKISLYQIPFETFEVKIPIIEVIVHQKNSRRSVSLTLHDTGLYMKNNTIKCDLFGSTKVHFDASDGFRSFSLAHPFNIACNGEFSDTINECTIEAQDPIHFEISTYIINQIFMNIAATEYNAEQPYSINNETGTDLIIIINKDSYKIKSQEKLLDAPNFADSDIKVQIGDIVNPIQIYSSFSRIAFPIFFDEHFILVWMDMKMLQLRLLSPISFKNKTSIDLKIKFLNQTISLKKREVYCLNYTIEKLDSITVKIGSNKQEVQLNESSVVNLDNKYIVVARKRKIETLHTAIVFRTPYYFRNEMISTLIISFNNKNIALKPCEIVPFPYSPPNSDVISFDILDSKDIKGAHVDLNINEDGFIVQTTDKNENPFIIQFTISYEKSCIISISPLLIYYNSLEIPLIFGLSPDDPIKREKVPNLSNSFFHLQSTQNVWVIDNPIMSSPLLKDNKDVNIYVSTKYSNQWNTNPFSMSDFDIIEDVTIPLNDEIVSLAHFHILNHCNIRPNTFIFFISPKFVINNQTTFSFSLNFFDNESVEISPNSTLPVTLIRKSLRFSISFIQNNNKKQNLIYSRKFSIEKVSSQYVKLNSLESPIILQSSSEKEIHFITIMTTKTLPYLFVNETNKKVIFIQKDTPDFAHVVRPNESLSFFIFDENMPTVIHCAIGNKINFELDVNEPSFPVKIKTEDSDLDLYYYVDLSRKEGSTITLCKILNDQISIKNDQISDSSLNFRKFIGLASRFDESSISFSLSTFHLMESEVLNFFVRFTHISCLLITTQYQELCRLTLKDININSSIREFSTETQLTINLIKLDDQNQYAIYPSVFQILPIGNKPALQFIRNSFGSHKYGKFELDVRPISLRIDLSFISDFIGDISNCKIQPTNPNIKFRMDDVQIAEIIHLLMPKQTKYHVNKIAIHPFQVHLSFQRITARSKHPFLEKFQFSRIINFIPSFDNIVISISESHFFRNLSGTTDEIVFKISHEIKKLVLRKLSQKINILGARKLVKNDGQNIIHFEEKTVSLKRGICHKLVSILSFGESTFCYISSMMDLYTGSPPCLRTDETSLGALSWGVSSLFDSFKKGAKQLFGEPLKRGVVNGKNDVCGYVVGAGIGFTKCAAFWASGFFNFNASLFSMVRRLFFSENFVFIDQRECEPSLGMHCFMNEKLLWYTGSVAYGLIEVYSQSVYISDGNIFIQNISKAETDGNTVIIFDKNMNKFISTFESENQASYFYNIVQSQLLRKKLFEIHDNNTIDDNV